VRLSPSGRFLSWCAPYERRLNVFVRDLEAGTEPVRVTSATERDVMGYVWANDDRLVYGQDKGGDENYRLYAVGRTALSLSGRGVRAVRILRRLGLGAALYLGLVLGVSALVPRQELAIGEPLCFDDWCLTVEDVRRESSPSEVTTVVELRLASRARGAPQREVGVQLTLSDASGRSFAPVPDAADAPLDVTLAPGESVVVTRRFVTPTDARVIGLVVAHAGFPIRWFLLGEGPLRKAPIVRFGAG